MKQFPRPAAAVLLSIACLLGTTLPASAQTYPSKPITLVSPFPPGGAIEAMSRAWINCASKQAGQPIVLLNKPGGNGVVAASYIRNVPNDGHSILLVGMSQFTITPFTFRNRPFDPEMDFKLAAMFASASNLLVANAQSGIKNLKDLERVARESPNGIDLGIPGVGTPPHLLGAAMAEKLKIRATHVPLAGEAGGITALLGGHVPAMMFLAGTAQPHIESGKLIPLMTFTEQRLPSLPGVPTVAEALGEPGFVRVPWVGISTVAGAPPEAVKAVDAWTKACSETPEFNQAMKSALFTTRYAGVTEAANVLGRDIAFWRPWIERLGIRND